MNDIQFLNLVSRYVQICSDLKDLVARIRGERTHVDSTGAAYPQVLSEVTFPLSGELSHVENLDQWLAMLACWEGLFTKFADEVTFTKADGEPTTTVVAQGIYNMIK